MLDGFLTPEYVDIDEVMPHAPYPVYPTGQKDSNKSIVRYGGDENPDPMLTIVDAIYAEDGTPYVLPGHYMLSLSDTKDFLLLIQSYDVIVRIPVFQLEEDQNEVQKKYDKKEQKKAKREKKKRASLQKKYDEFGLKPKAPYVYSNAEIEYDREKGYFLIKYEKGSIRAWGAIKQENY